MSLHGLACYQAGLQAVRRLASAPREQRQRGCFQFLNGGLGSRSNDSLPDSGSLASVVTPARVLFAALLIVAGGLACAYGVLIFASIDTSDTATGALVAFGLTLALPGVVAVVAGAWLLRRRSRRR